ncbi:MAG TPA: hypothetical protein PKV84_01650 [Candidatus Omnitrophota bacterium]|nr:hypothetical protein [Candidatus Omnitrophota bacterium]
MKKIKNFFNVLFSFFIILNIFNVNCFAENAKGKFMTQEEFEAAKRGQDKFHALLHAGDVSFKSGNNQQAEFYYLEAYKFSKGTSSEAVARYVLAKFYKDTGNYEKSLELVNIDLPKLKQEEPAWEIYSEMKKDLLEKIKEQKKLEKRDDAVDKIKKEFPKANPEQQKRFLETFSSEGVEGVYRAAFLAEQGRDFKKALEFYESLLPREDEILAAFKSEEGWVMLHPAIQRMSEITGDEAREKEMLVWIKANMLDPQGEYHKYLAGLLPNVQDHLKERIKKFNIQ